MADECFDPHPNLQDLIRLHDERTRTRASRRNDEASRWRQGAARLGLTYQTYRKHKLDGETWCSGHRRWEPADGFGPGLRNTLCRASRREYNRAYYVAERGGGIVSALSDVSLRIQIETGRLSVSPLADDAVQPSSIDLRLGALLLIAQPDGSHREHHLTDDGPYTVYQHTFLLGATLEWVAIPDDLVGVLCGKSTRARQGLQVEAAGLVDPGWTGCLTVEIVNLAPAPVTLTLGMAICQLYVTRLTTPAEHLYSGRYQRACGPTKAVADGRPS